MPVTCQVGGFFRLPPSIKLPWYNWNIVKCDVKHHKPKPTILKCYNTIYEYIPLYILLYSRNPVSMETFPKNVLSECNKHSLFSEFQTNIPHIPTKLSRHELAHWSLELLGFVSKTEMVDKHCGVESLKNSVLDIIESLKLFKSIEIAMKYFIFRIFHDFHLWI